MAVTAAEVDVVIADDGSGFDVVSITGVGTTVRLRWVRAAA